MFNKIKDFWTNVIEVTREKAEEIREDMKKKIQSQIQTLL